MKRSRLPLMITAGVLIFLYLPIVVLVVSSFNASKFGGEWTSFSVRWYRALLEDRDIWHAVRNTAIVALGATIVSTVIGTAAAFALHRYQGPLQRAHYLLIYAPLVLPEVLMGMSLLLLFVALGMELSLFTIFLAHVTFCISFVAMVVLGRLQDFDFSILEAARDLGAGWWTATFRVVLPLLAPGIAAGALLAFTLSVDDFVITFFVAGPGSTTLPLRIYSMMKHGSPPLINALSTVMLLVTFSCLLVSYRLNQGKDR